ncbi:MAG: leucine--tRNA ligase [Actinomycetota bacterium]
MTGPDEGTPSWRYTAELAGELESRWQRRWAERGTFVVPNPAPAAAGGPDGEDPLYVLDMFPYPSGAGLHVGHPLGYIASDVYARFMRMRGRRVLHPFGFDAFGLPAEQYAIETGKHPAVTTAENIDHMRRQLRRLGLGHDPSRELSTADPRFYRWTQWIFLQIFGAWFDPEAQAARPIQTLVEQFERGVRAPASPANPDRRPWPELDPVQRRRVVDSYRLAYLDEAPVNWSPGLGTVLANEEVTAEGRSAIGNYPVYRRRLRQWKLRITAYADRLLADLDALDWPDSLKTLQRNWIGRSEGAEVRFTAPTATGDSAEIVVYTTRPDTLFGATCLVLAPEHPLVDRLTAPAWPSGTPPAWQGPAPATGGPAASPAEAVDAYRRRAESLTDRQRQVERDKTAVFTGTLATNPASGEPLPVFVADYVLGGYGGGAIMAVPAHDQRDLEFARAFGLPVRAVVEPDRGWLEGHPGALADQADTWSEAFLGEGVAVNSRGGGLDLDGLGTAEATARTVAWLEETGNGRPRVSYRLRDWLFSRQRYWGEPFPIVYDETGLPLALPEEMLPVELPPMTDFRPHAGEDAEPRPPLSRAPGFEHVTLDLGQGPRAYRRETNTMPQWAGSCWYYLRYLDPADDRRFVDPALERYWMDRGGEQGGGVDLYIGGVEHAVLHLLYARFWHKVLFDLGHVSTPEPFHRLYNQGYILADAFTDPVGRYVPAAEVVDGRYQGQPVTRHLGKMGKSLKNGVSPDDIYQAYGADTLRLYEMAMGPLDDDRPWQPDDIVGVFRFLQRLWRNVVDEETGQTRVAGTGLAPSEPLYRQLHQTIDAVDALYRQLRYNVAIARLTELNNAVTRHVRDRGAAPREVVEPLVLMVAPLAPHLAAELWERLGHQDPLDDLAFPTADPEALATAAVVLPVTVDGRRRGEITVGPDADEEEVRRAALALGPVARLVGEGRVARVVHVPGRIVNVVTRA